MNPIVQGRRQAFLQCHGCRLNSRPRTQVTKNDQFILELVGAVEDIIQVHVSVLVDLFFAVIRTEKRHFRDQDFGFVHVVVTVQSGRRSISGETDKGCE